MLSERVRKHLSHISVSDAVADSVRGYKPIDIRPRILNAAVDQIKQAFKYMVTDYGLPHLATPRPGPLSNDFVMRALVMLRAIYKYETVHAADKPTIIKGGMYDGLPVIAPGREDLCGKNGGLIVDTYKALKIDELGYEASCGGTVGVMQAAHLLAEAGLIFERHETQTLEFDPQDTELIESYKKAKTPYALTHIGRLFCFWLFGDQLAIIKTNGINNNGYSGISPIGYSTKGNYSGWLNYLELDYPTSTDSDTMIKTLDHTTHSNEVLSENAEDDNSDTTEALAEITESLTKFADRVKITVDVNDLSGIDSAGDDEDIQRANRFRM